jgi:hypothetical protein
MRPSKFFLCSLMAVIFLPGSADAQLFRRNVQRTATVQSSCPGGVCPTRQVVRAAVPQVVRSSNHWSYPGTIDGHLQSTHGISTAGMSREQMLITHDAIHEGRYVTPRVAPVVIPASKPKSASVVPVPVPQAVKPVSVSEETFGLSKLVAVEIPSHVLAQIDNSKPAEVQESFRRNLAKAIAGARKEGKINARDAVKLRVSMLSPAFVERAQELAVTQMAFSGEASEHMPVDDEGVVQADGINWDGLLKFLEAFIPLLLTLLERFGL